MNKIITTLITVFISLAISAKTGKVKISGTVENHKESSVKITHIGNKEVMSSELDADGNFEMSAKIEDGYYLFNYGRNTAYVYLYPKDDLKISFDAKNFENTLKFSGQGAERNNYLAEKSIKDAQLKADLEAFYDVDETAFLNNLKDVKNTHLDLLSKYDIEKFFTSEEQKSLEYNRLLSIQNFKSSSEFYLGKEIELSDDFYSPINDLDLNKSEDYQKQPYYRYLVNSIWSSRIEEASDVNGMLKTLRKVKSKDVAISLINGFYSKISSKNERSKDYLDLIKKVTTYQPFIDAAEKRYKEVMESNAVKKGDVTPKFSYENRDGEIVNLSDFKGKYIYIDVWATWCAPCMKQIPYLKKLEERYHDKNIVFVGISVDKESFKSTWKQMLKDKKLSGVQLFADKSFDSDFMNALAVNSIPRFILIDPEGKILDPEAPRPSFDKTKTLLDGLLN